MNAFIFNKRFLFSIVAPRYTYTLYHKKARKKSGISHFSTSQRKALLPFNTSLDFNKSESSTSSLWGEVYTVIIYTP